MGRILSYNNDSGLMLVRNFILFSLSTLALLFFSVCANSENTQVLVRAEVIATPCVVNSNRSIQLDFGEITTGEIDGKKYEKKVLFELSCPGNESRKFYMYIAGAPTSFDKNAFASDVPELGFSIKKDDKIIEPHTYFPFIFNDLQEISITPVKNVSAKLLGGSFSASYTLIVIYD